MIVVHDRYCEYPEGVGNSLGAAVKAQMLSTKDSELAVDFPELYTEVVAIVALVAVW